MDRFGITDFRHFLTEQLHYLSIHTEADRFINHLRRRDVLSIDDEEIIRTHKTTKAMTAKLIDTIMYKGKAGFVAYMERLEFEYPKVFTRITGLVPLGRPKGSNVKRYECSRISIQLFQELHKFIGLALNDNLEYKIDIKKLNETIRDLELENEITIRNIENLQNKVRNYENCIDELRTIKHESYGKIKHLEEENKILKNKLNDHEKHVIRLRRQASSSEGHIIAPQLHDKANGVLHSLDGLEKLKSSFSEETEKSETLHETIKQLLDLNKRLNEELEKASEENNRHQVRLSGQWQGTEDLRGIIRREGAMRIKVTNDEA